MGDDYLLFDRRSNRWIGDNPPHRRKLGWSPPNDGHHFCVLWTLVLGGLLGAVLAIPLTATLKVLLHRYVWDRQRNIFFQDDISTKDEIEIAT